MENLSAKDLRIGNLLTWKDQEDYSTEAILTYVGGVLNDCIWLEWVWADGEADYTDCDLDCVKGIEITEQWLIDFGFKKEVLSYDSAYYYTLKLKDEKYCDLSICSGDKNGFIEVVLFPYEDWFRYKYVHELQNLYFAITGRELELNKL